MELTPDSPYWQLYIDFHSGRTPPHLRDKAKATLFHIHYGRWDTTRAWDEIARRRVENDADAIR